VKARLLQSDGTYQLPQLKRGQPLRRSQREFIETATEHKRGRKPGGQRGGGFARVQLKPSPFPKAKKPAG
jgi:hypothetical protein